MERIVESGRARRAQGERDGVRSDLRGHELEEQMAEFATTVHGLLALGDWLEALGVKQVAMEATGVY